MAFTNASTLGSLESYEATCCRPNLRSSSLVLSFPGTQSVLLLARFSLFSPGINPAGCLFVCSTSLVMSSSLFIAATYMFISSVLYPTLYSLVSTTSSSAFKTDFYQFSWRNSTKLDYCPEGRCSIRRFHLKM